MRRILLIILSVSITSICFSQSRLFQQKENEIKKVVNTCLECISGRKGEKRDWEKFKSIFLPTAQLTSVECYNDTSMVRVIPIERFVEIYAPIYESHTFRESNRKMKVQIFGNMAQVFQVYCSEMDTRKKAVLGVNSFQLVYEKGEWLIASLLWQSESKDHKVPRRLK